MMIGRFRGALLVSGFLSLALAGDALPQGTDTVQSRNGKSQKVSISSEDHDGVQFSVGGGKSMIRWKEVESVRYGNALDFYKAIDTSRSGKFAEAKPLLEKLAANDKLRPPLRQSVLYHLGLTQLRLGDLQASIQSFDALFQAFPKGRYLYTAADHLLSAHIAKEDFPGATKSLDAILAAMKKAEVEPAYMAGFGILQGLIFEKQGDFEKAQAAYEGIAANAEPDMLAAAKLGEARCLQAQSRKEDAEKRFRKLVTQDAPNSVLAGAWNGLGDLALEDGLAKRNVDQLRNAAFAYLRGAVLYLPEFDDSMETLEHALFGSGRAFKALGELEPDAEKKNTQLGRSRQLLEQLAGQFPTSSFLKK